MGNFSQGAVAATSVRWRRGGYGVEAAAWRLRPLRRPLAGGRRRCGGGSSSFWRPSKERRFGALDLLPKEELEEAKTKTNRSKLATQSWWDCRVQHNDLLIRVSFLWVSKLVLIIYAWWLGNVPKIAHSKKSTFQKEHIPKRTQSKTAQSWKDTLQRGNSVETA